MTPIPASVATRCFQPHGRDKSSFWHAFTLARSATAAALLMLAACSTGAETSDTAPGDKNSAGTDANVSSEVIEAVDAAQAEQTEWAGPSEPVSPPSGMKVVSITCSSQAAGCVNAGAGAAEAGEVLGWDVTVVDGKGDPNTWNAAVSQAVSDGADGIILNAVTPALVQGGLEQARAANVPVVLTFVPSYGGPEVDAYITSDHAASGEWMADWITVDSDGQGDVLVLEEPQFPELDERLSALADRLGSSCPDCALAESIEFNLGTMPQQLPGLVSSALQSNPDIRYVVAPFDGAALFASQGISQSGRTDVELVGFEGDPDGLARVAAGQQSADVATVQPWMGWAAIDALARLMTDQPVEQQEVPQRLFDADNVPEGDEGWQGDLDFRAQFRELWGV